MANLPPKADRKDAVCFRSFLCGARNLVERFFKKAKQFRRIATRYKKPAENYLAALRLVAIRIWLERSALKGTSPVHEPSSA